MYVWGRCSLVLKSERLLPGLPQLLLLLLLPLLLFSYLLLMFVVSALVMVALVSILVLFYVLGSGLMLLWPFLMGIWLVTSFREHVSPSLRRQELLSHPRALHHFPAARPSPRTGTDRPAAIPAEKVGQEGQGGPRSPCAMVVVRRRGHCV